MSFEHEEIYIENKKTQFESLFGLKADENPEQFILYLSEYTNRQLRFELEEINKNYMELKESGFFNRND